MEIREVGICLSDEKVSHNAYITQLYKYRITKHITGTGQRGGYPTAGADAVNRKKM
jgi:hypothetical protein